MQDSNVPAPPTVGARGLADWVEASLASSGRPYLTRSNMRAAFRNTAFLGESREDADTGIDSTLAEIERRRAILGNQYPFTVRRRRVYWGGEEHTLPYLFCLCLSVSRDFKERDEVTEAAIRFEHLMLDGLRAYLGPGAEGIRFGYPPTGDRPGGFEEALAWLADRVGLERGPAPPHPHKNDAGVDVVVWRSFSDDRPGHLIILRQSTVGRGWSGKERDVIQSVWQGFIDFGKYPVVAFGIPHVVNPKHRLWDELRRTVHIVLDRLRLCELLTEVDLKWEEQIRDWTEEELRLLGG